MESPRRVFSDLPNQRPLLRTKVPKQDIQQHRSRVAGLRKVDAATFRREFPLRELNIPAMALGMHYLTFGLYRRGRDRWQELNNRLDQVAVERFRRTSLASPYTDYSIDITHGKTRRRRVYHTELAALVTAAGVAGAAATGHTLIHLGDQQRPAPKAALSPTVNHKPGKAAPSMALHLTAPKADLHTATVSAMAGGKVAFRTFDKSIICVGRPDTVTMTAADHTLPLAAMERAVQPHNPYFNYMGITPPSRAQEFVHDVETSSLNPTLAQRVGIAAINSGHLPTGTEIVVPTGCVNIGG